MSLNFELIKACLNSIRDALIVINDQGLIEYWNPKAAEMFGYSSDEVRGQDLHKFVAPNTYCEQFNAAHAEFATQGTGNAIDKTVEVEALRRDGSLFPVELSLSTFQDRGRWHSVGIVRDISEQVTARQLLAEKGRWEQAVHTINSQKLHLQTLEQLLTHALVAVCKTTSAPFRQQGAIFVLDRANRLTLEATHQLDAALQQQASDCANRHCSCATSPQDTTDTPPDNALAGRGCTQQAAENHFFCFPLLDRKQRYRGALTLVIDTQPPATSKQVDALQLLANSTANLLDRHSLYQQNQRLRQIVEQNPVAIAITDPEGHFEYVNPQFCRVSGYSRNEVIGNTPRLISSGKTPLSVYQDLWGTISSGQTWRGDILNRKKNGTLFWESQLIWPVLDDTGIVSYIALKEDITERKHFRDQLKKLATHDVLTGLPNEQLLRDRIDQAIIKIERDACSYQLYAIDIKQMRLVNESFGLTIGNALIKEVAARLQRLFRKADTIARLSGDTFVLICSTEDSDAIASKISSLCADPFITAIADIPVELYISVLELNSADRDIEALLQRLTATLHHAKISDSSAPLYFDSSFDSNALQAFALKNDLSLALINDQFKLWYQPKVNILTGRVIGAEALIRWFHPERGMVSPLEFIGLAERSGQIIEIGRWVIREVIRQIAAWSEAGQFRQPVSLNVSARQLSDPQLLQTFKDSLREHQVDPALVELELTESVLAEDPVSVRQLLNQFASLGLKIALDDFGTGYSSLAYLSKLPIHTVKIDQSFVRGVCKDPQSAVIVTSTLSMCRDLGIQTIAEGVETESQGRFMSRHGCQQIQGYLFSKPLPADEFAILVQQGFAALKTGDKTEERVIILDDEQSILNAIRRSLHHTHYTLLLTTSPDQALEWLASYDIGVVITDQRMAAISGVEFLRKIKRAYPNTTRMVLSGYSDLETITQAINEGSVFRFLSKPWEAKNLETNIDEGFYYYNLRTSSIKKEALLNRIKRSSLLALTNDRLEMSMIDDQHDELINKHNLLTDAYFTNSEPSTIIQLYNDFTDTCRQHFADEEKIMAEMLYPGLESHKKEHDALLTKITEQGINLADNFDGIDPYQLIYFLKDCISAHIRAWDMPIGRYLINHPEQEFSPRVR